MPDGVHAVKKGKRTYYYYAPGRGTPAAGKRVALGTDPQDPEFWRKLRAARGASVGTLDDLIAEYQKSPEWGRLRPTTQRDYTLYFNRLSAKGGDVEVASITRADIYATRDAMKDTPVAANHMISILRALLEWGVQRGYRPDNPAIGVPSIRVEADGAKPWPDEAWEFVIKHAPDDLVRMAYLGRVTGQRAGDLCRMRACDVRDSGIEIRIGKLRDRRHFVPLSELTLSTIRAWGVADLRPFLQSPTGAAYTANHLNSRWNRWRASEAAKPLRGMELTIHGLRATACCDRAMGGTPDNGIAAELGMSVQMVARYTRFIRRDELAKASLEARARRNKLAVDL